MFASTGSPWENVPEPFSYLSAEEYNRLSNLLDQILGRSILRSVSELISGKDARRVDEITSLTRLPDRDATRQTIAGAVLISTAATSPEQIKDRLIESLLKSKSITETGKVDQAQARVITFASIVASKVWEKKTSRQ